MNDNNPSQYQLLIMRHGKSDWGKNEADFDRTLTTAGVEAAQKIGRWLLDHDLIPDLIVTSPATRALMTTTEISGITGANEVKQDQRIWEASTSQLLDVISDTPTDCKKLMIVGHNPGFESLLLLLASVPNHFYKDYKLLTTGTLAVLNISCDWQSLEENCAEITDLIRGKYL